MGVEVSSVYSVVLVTKQLHSLLIISYTHNVGLCVCEGCPEAPCSNGALGLYPKQTTLLQACGEICRIRQVRDHQCSRPCAGIQGMMFILIRCIKPR